MADLRAYQPSFTSGALSPALWARVDLAKYGSGLKTAENIFIHPHGGASNRAGLEFVGEVKNSANPTRLIPFQFNSDQSYILEFGNLYMRVWKDGGLVLSAPATPFEIATPYLSSGLWAIVVTQEADVAYLTDGINAPRKLSRFADDNWTLTTPTFAPSTPVPTGLTASAFYRLIYTGGGGTATFKVTAISAGGAESAVSLGVPGEVRVDKDGRKTRFEWTASAGASRYRLYRTDLSVGILAETPNTNIEIDYTVAIGDGTAPPGASAPGAPPVPVGVTSAPVFGDEYTYKVAAISSSTGEESLPTAAVVVRNYMLIAGNKNYLEWTAVAGASAYIIYKLDNGQYGYIGRSEITSFTDENITADLSDGPQVGNNPFVGAANYPKCSTFIEQRLAFAATPSQPQGIFMSQTANYENFGKASPAKPSDSLTFRIKSRQANSIRALVPAKGMLVLSSGAEWVVSGGSASDAIGPSAIKIDNQGFRGAADIQPISVGNVVLFAQDRGCVIRDFSYQFAEDSFVGKDLTIMARHFFEGRSIRAWAYAQAPYSIVWVVLDNGSLVSLTYLKEHDVWGWTSHVTTDGLFEDVAVIPEGEDDVPYFVVRRLVNGGEVRYIERMHSRSFVSVEDAFFVDSGLTYTGAAATVISGLDHLEGKPVVALANGNVVRGLTVTGGSVTLPNSATKVHIGLPITSTMETLDLDLGSLPGLGTVQGRHLSVSEVTFRVQDTRGIFIGPKDGDRTSDRLVEFRQREGEAWNEAIQLLTGDISMTPMWTWQTGGNMFVKQFDPLPMTILAIMPDITVGR